VLTELQEQVAVELEQLQRLLHVHQELLEKCRKEAPNAIELSALAALLHGFYSGIENIFKRIVVELDGEPLRGNRWHRRLLDTMTRAGESRPQVISAPLCAVLPQIRA